MQAPRLKAAMAKPSIALSIGQAVTTSVQVFPRAASDFCAASFSGSDSVLVHEFRVVVDVKHLPRIRMRFPPKPDALYIAKAN